MAVRRLLSRYSRITLAAQKHRPQADIRANSNSAWWRSPISVARETDFSAESMTALAHALKISLAVRCKLYIVHVDHIVIADGLPQDWINDEPVRHIKLDTSHNNFGNTPRAPACIAGRTGTSTAGQGVLEAIACARERTLRVTVVDR
jgi:hypothetical protein